MSSSLRTSGGGSIIRNMKSLLVLIVGLMTVGCITPEQPLEPSQLPAEPSPANSPPNPTDQNTTKEGPVKELTLEESELGEYEWKYEDGSTTKLVFLENGITEMYRNGEKRNDAKWSISNGELHVVRDFGEIHVFRINKDKSITEIALIKDKKRSDWPYEVNTLKNIK